MNGAFYVDWLPQHTHGLPGRLGLTCAPGLSQGGLSEGGARLDEDLQALARVHGASALVTLLEDAEIALRVAPDFGDHVRRAGLELISFPIPDGWVPWSLWATAMLVESLLERMSSGSTVVVHCMAGLGRTGTIAACLLVARGRSAPEAILAVRRARPGSVQNPAQEAFVASFASSCSDRAARSRG